LVKNLLKKNIVYSNAWFNIIEKYYGEEKEPYYGLDTLDYVHVIAITEKDEILFVKQYRPIIEEYTLELPGGHIESGQLPEEAALLELKEETGYIAKSIELIGILHPDVGRLTNKIWSYYTEDIIIDDSRNSEHGIELKKYEIERIYDSIKSGTLNNAQNLGDLFLALPKIVNKLNLFDEIDRESV